MKPDRVRVLIVEDDFRIAAINQSLIEQAGDFEVVASLRSGAQARQWLSEHPEGADLALLDVYLPDVEGLSLLWDVRRLSRGLDIVMVTAARETETVEEALRAGVFDFLIKPVQAGRMHTMLARFRSRQRLARGRREVDQAELDAVLSSMYAAGDEPRQRGLPKGVDALSLERVLQALGQSQAALTASEVAQRMGSSRSTARRYLEYLVGSGQASVAPSYGEVGRPQRRYQLSTAHGTPDPAA